MPTKQPVETEQDVDYMLLLTAMGCCELDLKEAEVAYARFFEIFHPYLLDQAVKQGWEAAGIDCEELVIEVFVTAYKKADRFSCDETDCAKVRGKVISWLFTILKNKAVDELRRIARHRSVIVPFEDGMPGIEDAGIPLVHAPEQFAGPEPEIVIAARKCLGELNPKEHAMMALSLEYYDPVTRRFEIPDEELKILADSLGVVPASIKTLRHRVLSKIRAKLDPSTGR